jgi:hypothetical protein
MVPLLFWFNKDPRLAIPSVSIPYGQRFLNITLAKSTDLVELVTPPGADGSDTGTVPALTIAECSLFINNIFVNPEIHDIFIKRIGFTLIRVHRMQTTRVDKDNANILLNNMKWPIEYMFVAVKPVANTEVVAFPNNKSLQTWHRFSGFVDSVKNLDGVASSAIDAVAVAELDALAAVTAAGTILLTLDAYNAVAHTSSAAREIIAVASDASLLTGASPASIVAAVAAALAAARRLHPVREGTSAQVEVRKRVATIEKLSITAHGIDIYKEMPGTFFHSYTPYTFGGHNVSTPEDEGALMITFSIYPGSYQPSGHVNISRAREFYLQYWSGGVVSSASPADLIIIGSAINFLLISDGSAVLRYST